jgi:hypothetical protein
MTFAVLLSLIGASGCAPTVRSATEAAARAGAPAAADATLQVLEDQRMRERLAAVMATPEIQEAIQELSAGVAAGVVKGITTEEMAPERFAGAVTQQIMRSASAEISKSIAPAMHQAIVDDLGPAMRESMHKDLAPGFAAMLKSPDVQSALAETSREVARQAVLGSNEGLAELAEKRKRDEGGAPLGSIGAFFMRRTWLLALLVAAAVFSVPIVWLLRERRATKRELRHA